ERNEVQFAVRTDDDRFSICRESLFYVGPDMFVQSSQRGLESLSVSLGACRFLIKRDLPIDERFRTKRYPLRRAISANHYRAIASFQGRSAHKMVINQVFDKGSLWLQRTLHLLHGYFQRAPYLPQAGDLTHQSFLEFLRFCLQSPAFFLVRPKRFRGT